MICIKLCAREEFLLFVICFFVEKVVILHPFIKDQKEMKENNKN